jgi:hypothetical protein
MDMLSCREEDMKGSPAQEIVVPILVRFNDGSGLGRFH